MCIAKAAYETAKVAYETACERVTAFYDVEVRPQKRAQSVMERDTRPVSDNPKEDCIKSSMDRFIS